MEQVTPGDGHALARYRWWQQFSRSLFHLRLRIDAATFETWSVDVRIGGDEDGNVHAQLYRDGVNVARSALPAAFPVPGGVIEVAASAYGLKRCDYVTPDGARRQLVPDPASAEGRRAHLDRTRPGFSRALGTASVVVLIVALVVGVPQGIEQITTIPVVADTIGTFISPFQLPAWANISLVFVAIAASTERALRLRHNWLLDGSLFEGGE
ncbi:MULTISPECIES: hypothetical protein [unclassified Microbacterium]|uniref:hypothetical protein n=1 Tax=unclassified Microbacterium TaxID=2609290 RepID=UPI00214AB545|nr:MULTISPECIES: hypothetical protein [unclassified Microbacterium]MCR2810605.1 hypothetical protein [Microbacterium sp. zg.B185]WIM18142.1 hypothetical protein QNO12_11060 [Microbacterium sp. zg-B185]